MFAKTLTPNHKFSTTLPDRVTNLFRQNDKVHLAEKLQLGSRSLIFFKLLENIILNRPKEQLTNRTSAIVKAITMQAIYTNRRIRVL